MLSIRFIPGSGAPLSAVEEIATKIERRLIDLEDELESLRRALIALEREAAARPDSAQTSRDGDARGTPASPRPRGTRRARRSAARTRAGTDSQAQPAPNRELERLLAETGGISAVELAKQTGTDPAEVLARIRELERAGRG